MVSEPVLIVDDEVEMRIAMSETLKHCGYPVEISHNAIDAIKKFKQNNYSLVITDMTMPKRSGLELLKDIKSIAPAKPVIMATAYGTVETAVEAMKHGAFDYIKKPINFDSFQFIVQQALNYEGMTGSVSIDVESKKSNSKSIHFKKKNDARKLNEAFQFLIQKRRKLTGRAMHANWQISAAKCNTKMRSVPSHSVNRLPSIILLKSFQSLVLTIPSLQLERHCV